MDGDNKHITDPEIKSKYQLPPALGGFPVFCVMMNVIYVT
jgi:hypothetical protein